MYRRKNRECPNPLFLKWLEEWRVEASEKNSKLQYAYAKAISSLKKYPLPLQNGQEAMILDNVGGMIARRLDEALAKYHSNNQEAVESIKVSDEIHVLVEEADPIAESVQVSPPVTCNTNSDVTEETSRKRKHPRQKASREYIPSHRSGPYALILTLYQQSQLPNYPGYMTKTELQRDAQPLSDASFTVPDPGKHYTAWSSMSSLIKKGYVIKEGNPARYLITDSGCVLAQKLESVMPDSLMSPTNSSSTMPLASDLISLPLSCSSVQSTFNSSDVKVSTNKFHCHDNHYIEAERNEFTRIENKQQEESNLTVQRPESKIPENPEYVLRPGSFDIILCVDFVETTGGATKSRKDALIPELKNNGVQFDVRKLQLGDFLWIARERTTPIPGCLQAPVACELVLDHIVERKRMDDLCGSIIDGRFKEQKFRLRHCGLKHPIYLVEDFGSSQHMSLPESTLQQAIVNTQVMDGFFVKRTHDLKESVAYLTLMTRYLQRMYKNKTLFSCREGGVVQAPSDGSTSYLMTFKEFNDSTVKNKVMTVSEIFAKQLMQIRGVSADKAAAILEKYPTPKKLLDAYEAQITEKDKELMLSTLKAGRSQRNIGPSLSSLIYRLFDSTTLC